MVTRGGSVLWFGNYKGGKGHVSTDSRCLNDYPFDLQSRVGSARGTQPEELFAAAFSASIILELSRILDREGVSVDYLNGSTKVDMTVVEGESTISALIFVLKAQIAGVSSADLTTLVGVAATSCSLCRMVSTLPVRFEIDLIESRAHEGAVMDEKFAAPSTR